MDQTNYIEEQKPVAEQPHKISVGGHINTYINFAMQQNYVPIIRNLVITNKTESTLKNLKVKILFEPNFAREYSHEIPSIEAGKSVTISPVRINLSTEFLFSLTEKLVGNMFIEVYEGEEKIYEESIETSLLTYDQWTGLGLMPEFIGAFITPNHPVIGEIISRGANYLAQWGKAPKFTGYQTNNPNNVKLQMAALYAALLERQIVYNNPPASYEEIGQRVRLPHKVLETKEGTCIDLAVLYVTCLEAVGLNPLIVFIKGHAFAACHLEKQTFADCVEDDVSAIEKRIVAGSEELLLVECTDFTVGKSIDFEHALKHGRDHLNFIQNFECVVDVMRTRGSGIRPMPLRIEDARAIGGETTMEAFASGANGSFGANGTPGYNSADGIGVFNSEFVEAPKDLELRQMADLSGAQEEITKQKVWERKLLDFSLRNSLLNFRPTKNSFQIMSADLAELEDKLAEGTDFRVLEIPTEWTVPVRDAKIYEIENQKDLIQAIATEEFKNGRIRTFMPAEVLAESLKGIYRAAKVSIEENGSNTLFLALGFLRWYETELSEKPRYAPVVLIPIEIVKSVKNGGYVIRSRQEDAQINITLLEYLRQIMGVKISGLDPLPTDEHGIDLQLVFHTIRKAIMEKKNWNIEEIAFVGLFSFGQFVMWNDIRNRADELAKNKVVSSLIEGGMTWEAKEAPVTLDDLDEKFRPEMMAVPMQADSSQMVAIARAAGGESFVLHGPPGTGKSQTITNMIANALYQGQSVLFVAEKMAALNVVKKRLTSIGLSPFCLEIHSNKSSKTSVLSQLNSALEVGRIKAPEEYAATAEKLYELRCKLNSVLEAVHQKRDYGKSLYEAIGIFEDTRGLKDKIVLAEDKTQAKADNINAWQDAIREYSVALCDVGAYADSPLKGYKGREYSIELREQLNKDASDVLQSITAAGESFNRLRSWANLMEYSTKTAADEFVDIEEMLLNPAPVLGDLILAQNFDELVSAINGACQDGITFNGLDAEIRSTFEESIFTFNVSEAMMEYKRADMSWFVPKLMGKSKLKKNLAVYAKNPSVITSDNLYSYYEKLSNHLTLNINISQISDDVIKALGALFKEKATDWQLVINAVNKAAYIRSFILKVQPEKRESYVQAIEKYQALDQMSDEARTVLEDVRELKAFEAQLKSFSDKYFVSLDDLKDANEWYEMVQARITGYRDNLSMLKNWITLQQKAAKITELGIEEVHNAWENGDVTGDNVLDAFLCNLYYLFILKTIREDSRLADFQGKQYEDTIKRYSELVEDYRKLTVQELVARLSAKVPVTGTSTGAVATSEIGILNKAIKSNGRMLSIRKLFDEIPTLLRRICPCMLMSPISVAQYIDPSFPKFDLVIFDEASQIPTSSAVGTIARGENVVIVGDPKQLPPTSFFSANRVDEDNMEQEDLESLLDDCLSISMPQEHLKWHYRSRHESLIAYSNMQYYENKLYTFPSPSDLVSEVKYVPVEGFYDKGKTKQNKAEAQAVVDEIIRRLSDKKLREDSIGVVTFSSVQQNLIDDMLTVAFAKHPELEEYDRNSKEPVFIKNLENVQGDERDVILFSIGYGPDKDGKVSMNFGPLNREGGWRRLNVAISRARKSMIVYSTLKPEHIDLSRTRAEGVAGLKGFLQFAIGGKNALAMNSEAVSKSKDLLVEALAKAIRNMGYEVECNIGCSEYKMDIGIVDSDNPGTYLLGILVDGENCKRSATAKDRFVSQPGVLEGLGWKLMRVWTLDWMDEADTVLERIKKQVELAKEEKAKLLAEMEDEAAKDAEAEEDAIEAASEVEASPEAAQEIANESDDSVFVINGIQFQREDVLRETKAVPYEAYDIETIYPTEEFYLPETVGVIAALAQNILATEAPISKKSLYRKLNLAWGISRLGGRSEAVLDMALARVPKKEVIYNENVFYWLVDQEPDNYQGYRVDDISEGGFKRSMDDIASVEIINALLEVLDEQISLSKEDLIRETARKFGYTRLGSVIDTAVTYALDMAVAKGCVTTDNVRYMRAQ